MGSRFLFLIFTLFFVSKVLAAPIQYKIDSRMYFNGKKIMSPRMITMNGEKAKILSGNQKAQQEYLVEITPIQIQGDKVRLHYNVTVKEKDEEIISRGEFTVPENKSSHISIDNSRVEIFLEVKKS